jgi:uncharacterized membrane protein
MEDALVGLLILLGLVALAVPLLLVVALIKIANARARIESLEHEVAHLQAQVHGVEARVDAQQAVADRFAGARAAESVVPPAAPARPQPAAASPPPSVAAEPVAPPAVEQAAVEQAASSTTTAAPPTEPPITGRARFDIPDGPIPTRPASSTGPTVPPPLPPRDAERPAAARTHASAHVPPPRPRPPAPPPSDPIGDAFGAVRRWFTEGNVPVKIGMLVLLAGVAALLKYANDQGWMRVPMELRLAGIAAAAIAGLVFAWRQREERRAFALSLQGGAIGVLMLTTFAAFKLYHFLDAGPAFAVTIALVAGLGVLAVLQNALALAVFGLLAGFLAPIWLSTGSGNHVALFSYYAVLNLGIFGIAWNRPWRLLNLLGFAFTFAIGTLWGVLDYQPEKFATTEPFLLLFFGLYLLIPVFYARRRHEEGDTDNLHGLVDGTLVFGTPLVAFALQAGLLEGERMPLALSALGVAAIYALLAAALRRREHFASLVDTYAVLAVGFATLAVPLALSARATASVFALEGAALVWLGVRQERRLPQLSGLLLQLFAAGAYIAGIGGMSSGFNAMAAATASTPIANPAFMSALLIAIAGLATAWCYRREHDGGIVALFALWGLGWWTFAGCREIVDHVPAGHRVDALFAFLVATGWATAEARRRLDDMAVFGATAAAALVLGVPFAIAQTAEHDHPFAEWGWASWLVFAALGWRALSCLRPTGAMVRFIAHGGWLWAWTTAIALAAFHLVYRSSVDPSGAVVAAMGDGWRIVALGLPVLLLVAALQLRPSLVAPPLAEDFDDYRKPLWIIGLCVLAFGWMLSLFFEGRSAPLPWIVAVNPLELFQLATLALFAQQVWGGREDGRAPSGVPAFALAAFVWVTFATLRAAHHWGGAPWSPSMLGDDVVQTALTVVWSVLGVLGWIFGSRRGDRMLWGAGAVLMAVVLLKLLLVDRELLGNLFGIVSFLAYGLLCTAVGYFAPAPPRRPAEA